jgi:ribosomal protein L11 methyltransferase
MIGGATAALGSSSPWYWLQVSFEVGAGAAERLTELLESLDAVAVTLDAASDEPRFDEPGLGSALWENTHVRALFGSGVDLERMLNGLATALHPDPIPPYTVDRIDDQDWSRVWMAQYEPLCFANNLWVVPSWLSPPDPQAINILLDPGMAFGTGTHATTALCLEWLAQQTLTDRIVIDYGCGSGILAIAAAKLGAAQVVAVDLDPQALRVTRENAAKNDVHERLVTCLPSEIDRLAGHVLVANILLRPLLDLAPLFAQLLEKNGPMGLSGLLVQQLDECAAAYVPWFHVTERRLRDDWGLLSGVRR